jgi:hypothetical protein
MKDTRSLAYAAPGGAGLTGPGLAPGKRTLTDGLEGPLLGPAALARARRSNPIYHAQLEYDPKAFGAGEDLGSDAFALAVAKYQKTHGLVVDGMAGPITVGTLGGKAPAPTPTPDGPTPDGPTPTPDGPAPDGPAPEPPAPEPEPPAPEPKPPRTEHTEYGTYIVYADDFVGPLPPDGAEGHNVREAELRRIIAEKDKAAVAGREKAIDQVDDLLSYGAFDWAITDAEATKALGLLGALPMSQLKVAVTRINEHEYGNGTAIFTRDGDSARQFCEEIQVGMVGVNVPIPVPMAFHSFGGWKRSLFGPLHMHGPDGVRFYTKMKTITARWPTGLRAGSEFSMPTMK